MANQDLINYIKEQINAGIRKDDIKKALLEVGWPEKDIEDAFEELNQKALGPTEEIKLPPENIIDLKAKDTKPKEPVKFISPEFFSSQISSNIVTIKPPENQTTQILNNKNQFNLGPADKTSEQQVKIISTSPRPKKFKIIIDVLFGLLSIGLLGLIVFLYIQNNNLKNRLVASNSQQGDLEGQVQSLTKIINNLQKELSTLKEDNNNLLNEKNDLLNQILLFSSATSSLEVEVKAIPLKEGNQYLLKTSQNILVTVKNPTEVVKKILDKFLNQNIEVSGLRIPGRREITITEINKESLEKWEEKITNQSVTPQTPPISTE